MNETEEQRLWRQVQQATAKLDRGSRSADHSGAFDHALQVALAADALSSLPPKEVEMITAMSWFGPPNADAPPTAMRKELHELVQACRPTKGQKSATVAEIVVAYGCGAWRQVESGDGRWEHRWQAALDWLSHRVQGWIRATVMWLHFGLRLQGYALVVPFPSRSEAQLEAMDLASLLWLGRCDCWRLRQPDADAPPDRQSKERAERCRAEHRLSAWRPEEMAFSDFIARAIKGDKAKGKASHRKGFASGAMIQGMFFSQLYREHEVRFGRVLGWHCSRHPKAFCEEEYCFPCKKENVSTPFNETRHAHTVKRLLVVKKPQGRYAEAQFWHCQQGTCRSYYQVQHAICPLCRAARMRGAAKSTVWVREAPVVRLDLSSLHLGIDELPSETKRAIQEAFALLDPVEQQVVAMVTIEGRSQEETAQELDLSLSRVKQHHKNALAKLKTSLSDA